MDKNRLSYAWKGFAAVGLLAIALAGCSGGGGGGGGGDVVTPTPPPVTTPPTIGSAAANPANDTAINPTAAFTVVQNSGVAAVTINSPPKVNFTVISDGAVVKNLTPGNARFIIAKLVRGTNGNPDQWQSYNWRTETATASVGPGGRAALASAKQPTTVTATASTLVYNDAGYYTFTFTDDIKDPTKTNGVTFDANATHRIAIQLSYTNAAGAAVLVNPYFDFTVDASGKAVPVTDSGKTRKVVDVSTCNQCHDKLALHGGGRVDTQFCVLCHNSGNTDANSGNVLDFRIMVHKIHAGKLLNEKNGEDYTIWGFSDSKHSYADVTFPANIRNCAKCHDSTSKKADGTPLNPQGDNWKTVPSKEVCLACHKSSSGSNWYSIHVSSLRLGTSASAIPNSVCADCHGSGKPWSPDKAHWLQELENTVLYQHNIESVTLTTKPTATTAGLLTVKYSLVNPANGTPYNLREGCAASSTQKDIGGNLIGVKCNTNYRWFVSSPPGTPQDKFGTIQLELGVNDVFTQSTNGDTTTDVGGTYGYQGIDDGNHHYTLTVTVPKGSHGNARLVMLGSVAERRLNPITREAAGAVPPVALTDLAMVPVKNAIYEFNLDTGAKATATRRQIVSNDKCNKCHSFLGIPIDPEEGDTVFHSGVRNNSENCEVCHNAYRSGSYTGMTEGNAYNESWNFKRMIHGIHGGAARTYPFTHGNDYVGEFNKDGVLIADGVTTLQNRLGGTPPDQVENYTADVAYPQSPKNCNACHVNDSWKQNLAVLGSSLYSSSLSKNSSVTTPSFPVLNTSYTNPGIDGFLASGACVGQTGTKAALNVACASVDKSKIPMISPKVAVCTSCHDDLGRRDHVKYMGGGAFGTNYKGQTISQADIFAGKVFEACDGCHAVGASLKPIDVAHGLK